LTAAFPFPKRKESEVKPLLVSDTEALQCLPNASRISLSGPYRRAPKRPLGLVAQAIRLPVSKLVQAFEDNMDEFQPAIKVDTVK